jgi:hypothetical protein
VSLWLGSVLLGLLLATLGAYAVARIELRGGGAPRFSWRLGLAGVQVFLSTWTVVQVAAAVVLEAAALEGRAAELALAAERATLGAVLGWLPFAGATLVLGALAVRRGDREAIVAPLFAAATYAVALIAVSQSSLGQ